MTENELEAIEALITRVRGLEAKLGRAKDALNFYAGFCPVVVQMTNDKIHKVLELSQLTAGIVWDTEMPNEESAPKEFGFIARAALSELE